MLAMIYGVGGEQWSTPQGTAETKAPSLPHTPEGPGKVVPHRGVPLAGIVGSALLPTDAEVALLCPGLPFALRLIQHPPPQIWFAKFTQAKGSLRASPLN